MGVAHYAKTLSGTLDALGGKPALVRDAPLGDTRRQDRVTAWLRAQRSGPRPLAALETDGGWRSDLFAEAQSYFNRHGRLLEITARSPPQIMHWTYPVPLAMAGTRNLYTIHDLIPLQRPDLTGIDPRRHRRLLDAILGRADQLVTVSEHSRRALIDTLGAPPEAVTNTWQAAMDAVHGIRSDAPPAGLPSGGYLLAIGAVDPRKNLVRLARAWRQSGTSLPLVIAGPDGWKSRVVLRDLPTDPAPIRMPWLDRPALLDLIAHARALLFPSLAEGFGLPALEAMHLGVPVLVARGGALEEVVGEDGLTVTPEDENALAVAIARLALDEELRQGLVRAGQRRAQFFSQQAYGSRLAALYRAVAARPLR
ncbi:glycosyltransferase family 1 protein [Caulobacter sp. CCNWLW153]|uniref:glycosyltransferase family 4 protein n=1 Tax=unclassified Caulobacter TaxID=2648921 RepID=UPI002FF2BD20